MTWLAAWEIVKRLPWKLIGCVAVVLAVIAAVYFFGESRYTQGASDANADWQKRIDTAEKRANTAELRLQQDIANRSEAAHTRTVERIRYVQAARQEIADATTTEARIAALHSLRQRLRDEASAHLDRAIHAYDLSVQPA